MVYVEVQSKRPFEHFAYNLVARGKVAYSGTIKVPKRKYHVFKFVATFELAPRVEIIVYQFKGDELLASKAEIEFTEDLSNYLKIKMSTQEASPGQNVSIDVISNRQSYIGLLVVDQSVLLLKKNNALTKEEAFSELGSYQSQHHPVSDFSYSSRYFGTDYIWSNIILFTNAMKQEGKSEYSIII